MSKAERKMSPEEVQGLLAFRRKGSAVSPKKGKGSYSRKPKHRGLGD